MELFYPYLQTTIIKLELGKLNYYVKIVFK